MRSFLVPYAVAFAIGLTFVAIHFRRAVGFSTPEPTGLQAVTIDPRMYDTYVLSDSTWLCRPTGVPGKVECFDPPPGTVLMIPRRRDF